MVWRQKHVGRYDTMHNMQDSKEKETRVDEDCAG